MKLPQLMSQGEFDTFLKESDRIEAITAAYADGRIGQLPDRHFKYYQQLKKAFAILLDEPVTRKARHKIEEAMNISYGQAAKLINDVQELFPQLEQASKEFDRLMDINRIERLIDKIENGVDTLLPVLDARLQPTGEEETKRIGGDVHSKSLPALYKLLIELKGTNNHEQAGPPENFALPVPQYSTDINDMPGAAAEDVEHEVLEN